MKKKLSLILALLLVFSLVLTACDKTTPATGETPEYVFTSEISDKTKAEVDDVLATFMQAFEENNPSLAAPLFSSGFEATDENIGAFFTEVAKLVDKPFMPYDSYYMNNLTVSESPIKVKKNADAGDFIEITPASSELYCAMYVSEGEKVSRMMSILLAKEGGKFKITWISPTDFKYDGEDAPAIYEKTKTLSDDDKLFAAYVSSCMLGNIFRPGGFFRYENDLDMEDICYKLFSDISGTYALPLELSDTSNSSIYEIGIANDEEHGIIPMIFYKTDVPVDNEEELRNESAKVLAAIEKLSPGLSENFEYIRFDATNDEITEDTTTINKKTLNLKA